MRLISARVRGAGRLLDTTIKLDQKLVAIVGPNEAGKTTLLKALAYVDASDALAPAQRSRASTSIEDSTPVVSLRYRVSDEVRKDLADLELEEAPTEFFVSRRADGEGPNFTVSPAPRKSEVALKQLAIDLSDSLAATTVLEPLPIDAAEDGETPEPLDGGPLLDELRLLQQDLDAYLAAPVDDREPIDVLRQRADEDVEALKAFADTDSLQRLLPALGAWVDRDDPTETTKEELWNRTPDVVMFTEADRTLASTYTLDDGLLGDVPAALANLTRLAGLDLNALVQAVQTGQVSRRDTIKNKANITLANYFKNAWQQSDLKVELNVENSILRIGLVEDGVHASVFDERSAGLRMFVALTSFLAARDSGRATILLIDEAETHLHIDAQADLVQMFAKQDKADKIIYTTHSPGCLPADLGVGIRAVVPDSDETSHVENSFWRQGGGGFTSLMFAMGASAAAFTPARCAVIAEGATDMIVLPTLMRAAIGVDSLPYQVAPGLSEMPKDSYPELDFQAAKVAFLVDGDGGGERLAEAIGRAIPEDRIVAIGVHGIENTLEPDFYRDAFTTLLRDLNVTIGEPPTLPDATAAPWATALETWATSQGWRVPTKQEIANHIIELDEVLLSSQGVLALKQAHAALLAALGISS
ncbi:AAA family ATPase [Nocardioides sp. LHD-245]|uniref:AAA family ATPase n=1 Tax=Nocardioides sp. LHD-245 TaxID=3051387 RepID=UPI0027DF629B|nr:AAA family ATPase [Nocardioides sp. LHD-245]